MDNVRTVNSARNPVWADYAQTKIDLEVDFNELDYDYVLFTADPNDCEPHGVELYNRAIAGEFGEISPFPIPENVVGDKAMSTLREERNALLEKTDYIEIPSKWNSLSAEEQSAWTVYRQALRDLPANNPDAELTWNDDYTMFGIWVNVDWPESP